MFILTGILSGGGLGNSIVDIILDTVILISDIIVGPTPWTPANMQVVATDGITKVKGVANGPVTFGVAGPFDTTYTATYTSNNLRVNGTTLFTLSGILSFDIGFDKDGFPVIAYETVAGITVYEHQTIVHTLRSPLSTNPFITLDTSSTSFIANAGLVLAYEKSDGTAAYLLSNDGYTTETVVANLGFDGSLVAAGMVGDAGGVKKLSPIDPDVTDRFGYVAAIAPTSGEVIVAAPFGDEPATDDGVLYAFVDGVQTQKIPVPTAPGDQSFLANSSQNLIFLTDTLVLTARLQALYLLEKVGGVWGVIDVISERSTFSGFGFSMAVGGSTVVISGKDVGDHGSVYLYTISGNTLTFRDEMVNPTPIAAFNQATFGTSLSVSDDGLTIAVGDRVDSELGGDSGACTILNRVGNSLVFVKRVFSPNAVNSGHFSDEVVISGDGEYIFCNATSEVNHPIYMFKNNGGSWDHVSTSPLFIGSALTPGITMAFDGTTLYAGDPTSNYASSGSGSGQVFVFADAINTLTVTSILNEGAAPNHRYGESVAVDSNGVLVVGASGANNTFGAAYVGLEGTVQYSMKLTGTAITTI